MKMKILKWKMNAENEFNCLIKCPCHLLNLITTTDISKITNVTFKKLKKQVDRKLQNIWNKRSRSSLASDTIIKLGSLFIL